MFHPAFGELSRKPMVTGPTSLGLKPNAFFSVSAFRSSLQNSRNSSVLGRVT